MSGRVYDLFITHAWRYHDDWTRMGELLDHLPGVLWRNFSVPWYDPAMDPNTELGGQFVRRWLEQQIVPVCGVILLSSVYSSKSARKWVELEIELARRHQKLIVGVPAHGEEVMSPEALSHVDAACPWDARQILAAFDARLAS